MGFLGGRLGYGLLRRLGRDKASEDGSHAPAYEGRSKLEALFGPGIWAAVAGRTVIDFGCGAGRDCVEMARRGARRVIGLEIREHLLALGSRAAAEAGVADRCAFAVRTEEAADVIVSVDGFEHYDDPRAVLAAMSRLLRPEGRVWVAFGPPWLHPLGGHLFSVFPWAHLIFTEKALIRWRSDFKSDGASRFAEVAGGLNQMTVGRFCGLVRQSPLAFERFEAVPIRRLRRVANRLTREFTTSTVRCVLAHRPAPVPAPAR
jgi:SAM-dependent methyltransferase